MIDAATARAAPFDAPGIDPALEGTLRADGIEIGPDDETIVHHAVDVRPAFMHLIDHVKDYTPEWASQICDVPAASIRRVADEFLADARIGETMEIEGVALPFRPVAIALGKTVNNGWGGYECCWARTLLAFLLARSKFRAADARYHGAAQPPGRQSLVERGARPGRLHGLSDESHRKGRLDRRAVGAKRLSHAGALGGEFRLEPGAGADPSRLDDAEPRLRKSPRRIAAGRVAVYRTNPAISFWDTRSVSAAMAKFPFTVCFAFTHDETNHMADVLLPDCTDLEGLQLLRIGGTKYVEQFWDFQGFALRDQAVSPQGEAKDFTWIATELARRTGLLEAYNDAINRGAAGVKLSGTNYDFSLDPAAPHSVETIWDASCRAASAELTDGAETHGLAWFREHGFRVKPFSRLHWYLYPKLADVGLRFEQPYQERLFRIGKELGQRLHEHDIGWWDRQLAEYEPMPRWRDLGALWEDALTKHYQVRIADFPFWLITARSMQYSWGGNVGIQPMREVAGNVAGHGGVVMNETAAAKLGIADGDLVEVRSPLNSTRGRVMLCEGIRPDTLLIIGQFDHWATPYAKDFGAPNMNALVPMLLDLTDATGSGADLVRVQITRLAGAKSGVAA